MTGGWIWSRAKRAFRPTRPAPTALPWAIVLRPAGAGLKTQEYAHAASNGIVGASGCSPFFPHGAALNGTGIKLTTNKTIAIHPSVYPPESNGLYGSNGGG